MTLYQRLFLVFCGIVGFCVGVSAELNGHGPEVIAVTFHASILILTVYVIYIVGKSIVLHFED
jgi:hypothetical protein